MALRWDHFQTFIEDYSKHPEAGIKACEKKLKKEPHNTLYLLAQAQLQWRLRQYSNALATCQLVLTSTPKDRVDAALISEIQFTIAECQHGLQTFNHVAGNQIASSWKLVLDNVRGSSAKQARQDMLRSAWRDEYWDLAQQLFARLQKEFPAMTQYHFAWIAFSQLQADAMSPDDRMAQSLKLLAFRSLKTAFDNTVAEKESGRKISTSHHLRLATQIYKQQTQQDDLLLLLQSSKVGIKSSVGMNDGEFLRCEIELLQQKGFYDEIFNSCHSRLGDLILAREKHESDTVIDSLSGADDWFVWKAFLESGQQCSKPEAKDQVESIIERYLGFYAGNRNAGRALLTNESTKKATLLKTCLRFFDSNCTKVSCFGDLKDFLPKLSHGEQARFLDHIDEAAKAHNPFNSDAGTAEIDTKKAIEWVAVNVNALKFEYFLCISKVPLPEKDSLENFVSDCLRMYKLSLRVDKECGEEACILAVIGLVKLHHFSRDYDLDDGNPEPGTPEKKGGTDGEFSRKAYLIQAIYLLEFLRSNNEHNYSAALLLTTIYQMLGLTALAATAFEPLNIKEIQHDTISHLFWSRISINHPFSCKQSLMNRISKTSFSSDQIGGPYANPQSGLNSALYWYEAAADRIVTMIVDMLETIPFDKIYEFSQFKSRFENSFSRAVMTIESRRIERLTRNGLTADLLPPTFAKWTSDNRDFDTIPDFEYPTADRFNTFVTTRPVPMRYWLSRQTANDILSSLLSLKAPIPPYLTTLLHTSLTYLSENKTDSIYQLTPAEQFITKGWEILTRLIYSLTISPSDSHSSKNIPADISALLVWTTDLKTTPGTPPSDILPSSDVLQDIYLRLEILQIIIRTATFLSQTKHPQLTPAKQSIPKIKDAAKIAARNLQSASGKWAAELKKQGAKLIEGLFKAGETGEDVGEILELGEKDGGVMRAREILEAAVDAVEGFGVVSVG